jgi:hypothetical protein
MTQNVGLQWLQFFIVLGVAGCETSSSGSPSRAFGPVCTARSPNNTIPTRRFSRLNTGNRRICLFSIRFSAASISSSSSLCIQQICNHHTSDYPRHPSGPRLDGNIDETVCSFNDPARIREILSHRKCFFVGLKMYQFPRSLSS